MSIRAFASDNELTQTCWNEWGIWSDQIDGSKWAMEAAAPVSGHSLRRLREEVDDAAQSTKIPGKIRYKKVPKTEPCARNPARTYERMIDVYHVEDAKDFAKAFSSSPNLNQPLNLTGRRFGRLKVLVLNKRKSERLKRRWWLCRCDCGRQVVMSSHALASGHSKSCGCTAHRFTNADTKREHKAKAKQFVDGRWWWAPGLAMKFLGIWWNTLANKWATSCPWLPDQRGIDRRTLPSGYGRNITYYAEDDLRLAKSNKDRAALIPQFANVVYIKDALLELGWSRSTFYRRMATDKAKLAKRYGLSKDGRRIERTYVPLWFVQKHKSEYKHFAAESGTAAPSQPAARSAGRYANGTTTKMGGSAARDRAEPGRPISERNKKIYRTCNEMYSRAKAGEFKMSKAVAEVLKVCGPDALGRNATLEDQKTRLRMNAKTYRISKQFEGERN